VNYDQNNIFAKIIKKDIKANIILENEYFISFYDINPKAKIHALVIPKGQYIDYFDFYKNASDIEILEFKKGVNQVLEKLDLIQSGYRVIANSGINGGQEVPHFHIHILGGNKLGAMVGNNSTK
jgi:histidine triad (HIT) family protein